jgi:prepilin-type processing-associated H-X9-DG protein
MDNGHRNPDMQSNVDENLLGYMLKALDPDSHREVEFLLATRPELRQRLEMFRHSLEPLEGDRDGFDPPPGLAIRALARVAEYCCRELPRAPSIPASRAPAPGRHWWRRADVLVAAVLLLTVGILVPPVLNYLQQRHAIEACKNNLREFGNGLLAYSDHQTDKSFPNVNKEKSKYAGMVVPVLVHAGTLPEGVSLVCPGHGSCKSVPWTKDQLENKGDGTFDYQPKDPKELDNCYAYSLGFKDQGNGGIIRCHRRDEGSPVPIMSDAPPPNVYNKNLLSPNHGGRGQNVLFTDGSVKYLTDRTFQNDDIFLNQNNRVGAGLHAKDFVLGDYMARPEREDGTAD